MPTAASPKSIRIGRLDGHEEIAIRAGRPGGRMLALASGLVVWPLAALAKFGLGALFHGTFAFLLIIGAAVIAFLAYAILQLAWWAGGWERLAVIGRDLFVRYTIFGIPVATRSYRGHDIHFLDTTNVPTAGWLKEPSLPFLGMGGIGSLKFYYGERTVYLGQGLEAEDARLVVDWLTQRCSA